MIYLDNTTEIQRIYIPRGVIYTGATRASFNIIGSIPSYISSSDTRTFELSADTNASVWEIILNTESKRITFEETHSWDKSVTAITGTTGVTSFHVICLDNMVFQNYNGTAYPTRHYTIGSLPIYTASTVVNYNDNIEPVSKLLNEFSVEIPTRYTFNRDGYSNDWFLVIFGAYSSSYTDYRKCRIKQSGTMNLVICPPIGLNQYTTYQRNLSTSWFTFNSEWYETEYGGEWVPAVAINLIGTRPSNTICYVDIEYDGVLVDTLTFVM